jgi:putative membrane protein
MTSLRAFTAGMAALAAMSLGLVVSCDDDNNDTQFGQFDGGTAGGTGGGGATGGTGGGGSGGTTDGAAGGSADAGTDAATDAAIPAVTTDAEVVGVVMEANSGEVAAGQLAVTRAQVNGTRQFAMTMVEDHTAANQTLMTFSQNSGITPAPSALRTKVATEGQQTLATLQAQPAATFDQAYLQSQVTMHTEVLMLLDTQLLPVVQNPTLRADLTTMRATVATHLAAAQSLLAGLTADGGAADTGP